MVRASGVLRIEEVMGREGVVCAGAGAHAQTSGADRDCLLHMFSKPKEGVG